MQGVREQSPLPAHHPTEIGSDERGGILGRVCTERSPDPPGEKVEKREKGTLQKTHESGNRRMSLVAYDSHEA